MARVYVSLQNFMRTLPFVSCGKGWKGGWCWWFYDVHACRWANLYNTCTCANDDSTAVFATARHVDRARWHDILHRCCGASDKPDAKKCVAAMLTRNSLNIGRVSACVQNYRARLFVSTLENRQK